MTTILTLLLILFVLQLNIWLFIFAFNKAKQEIFIKDRNKEGLPPTLQDLLGGF